MGGRRKNMLEKCSNLSVSLPNWLHHKINMEDERRGYNCKSQIVAEALEAYFAEREAEDDIYREDMARFVERY